MAERKKTPIRDVSSLGQVFTPDDVVKTMIALRTGTGRALEPSCGDGAFLSKIENCVGIEIDRRVAPPDALNIDFFDYPETERFSCVIGNPPYVRFQDIPPMTKAKLRLDGYDRRTNLFVFFIDKCLRHLDDGGELILVVPREFMKATYGRTLNERLHAAGTFTDLVELGDEKIFKGFSPNCIIFRYVKGELSHQRRDGARQLVADGQLSFVKGNDFVRLGNILSVKVGAVSGDDEIFAEPTLGYFPIVSSTTRSSGNARLVIPDAPAHPPAVAAWLAKHEERLRRRRIKRYSDQNWWRWGRVSAPKKGPRIYVNAKTRTAEPFFTHSCEAWDGSILALFPLADDFGEDHAESLTKALNAVDWNELGFVCDGRFQFGQRSLEAAMLGPEFRRFLPKSIRAD
jgi:adenine-specific DNA-methyltransferase